MIGKVVKRDQIEEEARRFIERTGKIGQVNTKATASTDAREQATKRSARMIAQLIESNGSRVVD